MDRLPAEIYQKFCEFLEPEDWLTNRLVSKRWNLVSCDLLIKGPHIVTLKTSEDISMFISSMRSSFSPFPFTKFKFYWKVCTPSIFTAFLNIFSCYIKELYFINDEEEEDGHCGKCGGIQPSDDGTKETMLSNDKEVFQLLQNTKNLEILHLINLKEDIQAIATANLNLPHLKMLNIRPGKLIGSDNMCSFLNAFPSLQSLSGVGILADKGIAGNLPWILDRLRRIPNLSWILRIPTTRCGRRIIETIHQQTTPLKFENLEIEVESSEGPLVCIKELFHAWLQTQYENLKKLTIRHEAYMGMGRIKKLRLPELGKLTTFELCMKIVPKTGVSFEPPIFPLMASQFSSLKTVELSGPIDGGELSVFRNQVFDGVETLKLKSCLIDPYNVCISQKWDLIFPNLKSLEIEGLPWFWLSYFLKHLLKLEILKLKYSPHPSDKMPGAHWMIITGRAHWGSFCYFDMEQKPFSPERRSPLLPSLGNMKNLKELEIFKCNQQVVFAIAYLTLHGELPSLEKLKLEILKGEINEKEQRRFLTLLNAYHGKVIITYKIKK